MREERRANGKVVRDKEWKFEICRAIDTMFHDGRLSIQENDNLAVSVTGITRIRRPRAGE